MSTSQASQNYHRPAVDVKASPSSRITKQLERAADLEKQLSNLSRSNDEKGAYVRSQLCEILSDVIISNPLVGMENDCTGRLWRNCFYSPIGLWRSRINRERRKQGPSLASLEQSFKKFLGEAITLYDYLVLQYQSKLLPADSSQNENENSQESTQESSCEMEASLDGVVPGLYRLYIHLGDLHRYSESYNKAEACYLNASKLAPGMGNPYNQLAVVAQMKDANQSCVALYWYARSLLATHDPFETSNGNLERLFVINREYMSEHSRDPVPPILSQPNKKASSEMVRAQKAAANKSCLAHFVDFHYELFKKHKDEPQKYEPGLRKRMTAFAASFESLLQTSAFSDGLLFKMAVINTFSVVINKSRDTLMSGLSRDFLFVFGYSLGKRLEHILSKQRAKTAQLPSSIRLLSPYSILCEFAENMGREKMSSEEEDLFWHTFVKVANLVLQLGQEIEIEKPEVSLNGHAKNNRIQHPTKEYLMLKGYRPFGFIDKYASEDPFISPLDAVEVLELALSQSQESSSPGDSKLRFWSFFGFCQRSLAKEGLTISNDKNHLLIGGANKASAEAAVDVRVVDHKGVESPHRGSNVASNFDDDAGDIVLSNISSDENDRAPSVPLQSGVAAPDMGLNRRDDHFWSEPNERHQRLVPVKSMVSDASNFRSNQLPTDLGDPLPPPPGIKPPPGFGLSGFQELRPAGSVASQMFERNFAPSNMMTNQISNFEHCLPPRLPDAVAPTHIQGFLGAGQHPYMFDQQNLFSTANPFASLQTHQVVPARGQAGWYDTEPFVDGSSLLGSGLLESLFANDFGGKQTENPFVSQK